MSIHDRIHHVLVTNTDPDMFQDDLNMAVKHHRDCNRDVTVQFSTNSETALGVPVVLKTRYSAVIRAVG